MTSGFFALPRIAARAAIGIFLWWSLTEGDLSKWWIGALVIAAATAASLALQPVIGWRPVGLIRLLPFFLRQSILGGVDVARRALHPRLPLDPVFLECHLRLPAGPARVLLANTMSLLPGTVSVELREDRLRLHVLDQAMPAVATLRALEERIAALFGLELEAEQR